MEKVDLERRLPLTQSKKWIYFVYSLQAVLIFILFPHFLFPSLVGGGYYYEMRYLSLLLIFLLFIFLLYIKKEAHFPLKVSWILLLLVFTLTLSSWKSPFLTVEKLLLFASYAAAFFIGANLFEFRERLEKTLLFSAFLLSLYGLWQFLVGFNLIAEFVKKEGILAPALQSRIFSIFTSPSTFAGFLILVIPLGFYYSFKPRLNIYFLLTSLLLTTLFLTFSRGGVLSLIFLTLVLIFLLKDLKKVGKVLGVIVFSLLLAGAIYYISSSFNFIVSPQTPLESAVREEAVVESAQGRFEFWEGAVRIFSSYPLLGSGLGTFSQVYNQFQPGRWYSRFAHNIYLEVASETGVLGLIAFLSLILGIIFLVRDDEKKPFFLASLSGFLLHNFLDYDLNLSVVGIAFFLLAGLNTKEGKIFSFREANLLFPVFASLLVLLFFLSNFFQEAGINLLNSNNRNAGVKYLEVATLLNPLSARGHVWLAHGYLNNSEFINAFREAKKAVFYAPFNSSSWEILGLIEEVKGDLEKAETAYKRARDLSPKNPYYHRALGEFYLRHKKYEEAEKAFEKGLGLLPLYRGGMKDALERTPAYELILIYVDEGILQLEKKNFKKAYQYAEKAVSYKSNLAPALIVKGKALKALGREVEALLSFMEALEITESAEAHYEIGTIYEKEGKIEKAREHFQKALELNPKLEKAKEKLDSLGVKK
jgi:tetratricopeptide (TPR) repeat protein